MTASAGSHPVTPDGRYFVVRGRLWRMANPALAPEERHRLVRDLMIARLTVRDARNDQDEPSEKIAHTAVDVAKRALGERGPAWWGDDAPDYNRHMARNTPYADWFADLG
ncbi:hypothetical protein [Sphingomonas nostoxanthinifaciens]|uniref:hypothetical protein n=1 Tax=Sphingomonas nostoxanthinifaciens TaxID=2872652 RepID=UPI001CC1D08A|nr:hypothetical protein [Sphingomonas nostoxanthinifaciens]UAK25559.1 hypothetical protein K8P63_05225 [Sphingomonas nostoxanthinifaciens]